MGMYHFPMLGTLHYLHQHPLPHLQVLSQYVNRQRDLRLNQPQQLYVLYAEASWASPPFTNRR